MHVMFREFSDHHEITVYDTNELYGEKGSFRVMEFSNKAIQGAIDLNHPDRILFEYPRAMIHLMELNNPSFEDVFMIGHGIGTIAAYYPEKRFKISELNDKVVELSRKYFGYSLDNVVIGDGRHTLANESNHAYDYIILDAFSDKGTPRHLTSKEFFRMTSEKLDPHGAILINLIGKGDNDRLIHAIHTTLGEVYEYTQSFALQSKDGRTNIQNILIIGRNKPIAFQLRNMAGFTEIELGQGYIIMDSDPT